MYKRAIALLIGIFMSGQSVWAGTGTLTAKVSMIMIDETRYAGCGAKLTVSPTTVLGTCGSDWVTMDCNGDLGTPKSISANMLSALQLAFITKGTVRVVVDDSKIANGKCFAKNIQNR